MMKKLSQFHMHLTFLPSFLLPPPISPSSLHLSFIPLSLLPPTISPCVQPQMYDKLKFFRESEVYWAPANTTSGLYNQLSDYKYREIPRSQIE